MKNKENNALLTYTIYLICSISLLSAFNSNPLPKLNELSRLSNVEVKENEGNIDSNNDNVDSKDKPASMKFNSNLVILSEFIADTVYTKNLDIKKDFINKNSFTSNSIETDRLEANSVLVNHIYSETGTITIEGNVVINNNLISDITDSNNTPSTSSNDEKKSNSGSNNRKINIKTKSFAVDGIQQWQLFHIEDFDNNDIDVKNNENLWVEKNSLKTQHDLLSSCKNSTNRFIGGYCNTSNNDIIKKFSNLPKHSHIKINALFHMIDKWNNNKAYVKVNDRVIWSKKGNNIISKVDLCGNSSFDAGIGM